jgi:hypothetical protein
MSFKTMTTEQIRDFVNEISPVPGGYNVVVTYSNMSSFYGFFDCFNISEELMKENKWHFIPRHNLALFLEDLYKTKIPNTDYSIIIDGNNISKLELVKVY